MHPRFKRRLEQLKAGQLFRVPGQYFRHGPPATVTRLNPLVRLKDMTPEQGKRYAHEQVMRNIAAAQRNKEQRDPGSYPVEAPNFMARMGRGFMDVGQGVKQLALQASDAFTGDHDSEDYRQQVNDELELYDKGRAAAGGGTDWGRIAGGVAATAR